MKNHLHNTCLYLVLISIISLSSFTVRKSGSAEHKTITRTIEKNSAGKEIIKTQIFFDKTTSREAVIDACSKLSKEQVQLTFDQLSIRKSFLGLLGKNRIAYAKGKLHLPNGLAERFEAGGTFNFRFIKLIYTQESQTGNYTLNMVEIVD